MSLEHKNTSESTPSIEVPITDDINERTQNFLERSGLIDRLASSATIDDAPRATSRSRDIRVRIKRPKYEFDPSVASTKFIKEPQHIPIHEVMPNEMDGIFARDIIRSRNIDPSVMAKIDIVGKDLYEYCVEIIKGDNTQKKYALATIIARGIVKINFNENFDWDVYIVPALAEEEGITVDQSEDVYDLAEKILIAKNPNLDEDSDEIDEYVDEYVDECKEYYDSENDAVTELVDRFTNFESTELDEIFEGDDSGRAKYDTLKVLNLLNLDKGRNKYFYRLLSYVFYYAYDKYDDLSKINVVEYYNNSRLLVQQKIDEGVIPQSFQEKLDKYHPKEMVVEPKLLAILDGRSDWAGYYHSGLDSKYVIIEENEDYIIPMDDENGKTDETKIYFREPGTDILYNEDSDYTMKIAIHELFHHLSGHSYYQKGEAIHNNKVGLEMAIGRFMNEAVTERLASKVMPEADQAYSEERALLYALQINSNGLLTDEIIYEAYLEEREEEGLPKLKALLKTIGQAYEEKGFLQIIDRIFEDQGYEEAIEYLKKATEKTGREFNDSILDRVEVSA